MMLLAGSQAFSRLGSGYCGVSKAQCKVLDRVGFSFQMLKYIVLITFLNSCRNVCRVHMASCGPEWLLIIQRQRYRVLLIDLITAGAQ